METTQWWHHVVWLVAAAALGYGIAALFAERLGWPRRLFLVPYVALSSLLIGAYLLWSSSNVASLLTFNWIHGLVAGALVGGLMVANVRSQPHSRRSSGPRILLDLGWLGIVYGLVDALFINVLPVLIAWNALDTLGWSSTTFGELVIGALALVASLAVALAYHVGYAEFRNKRVLLVLLGNGLITLAFLLSGSPLAAILSHVAMHLAAVIQGPDTTIQLPPHAVPGN